MEIIVQWKCGFCKKDNTSKLNAERVCGNCGKKEAAINISIKVDFLEKRTRGW